MPDPIFAHPRLAPLYDTFDGERHDLDAYVSIVEELGARHVLDVGCGTGSFAVRLGEAGVRVTAVDPAAASIAVARGKDGAHHVTWVHGDLTDPPPLFADVAVMTGNVAQVFLDEPTWTATLQGIRTALRPDGWLVFEIRRPEAQAWLDWAAQTDPVVLDVPGVGAVEQRRAVTEVSLPYVSFRYTYTFLEDGTQLTSDSKLWFRDRADVEGSLRANGFTITDVREAPDRPGLEHVFIAQRT